MGAQCTSQACCKTPGDRSEATLGEVALDGAVASSDANPLKKMPLNVEEPTMQEAEDKSRREAMKGAKRRQGFAAESVSNDTIRNYVKPVYAKDSQTKSRIKDVLLSNDKMSVLFGHLDSSALDDVLNAFQVLDFKMSEDIIKQGDEGDRLYICAEGTVDVHVRRGPPESPDDKGPKVVSLGAGALFGELALLYQAPRAATVTIASPSCTTWALDREPFKMLLAGASTKKLEKYEGFLTEVAVLKSLNHYELAKLSELLDSRLFDEGEEIIKQGDPGDEFFIIEDGTCSAYIRDESGEKEVKEYGQGDYFGEIALLKDGPRTASVRATSDVEVLVLSKEDFTNVLGPIQDILVGNIDAYVPQVIV